MVSRPSLRDRNRRDREESVIREAVCRPELFEQSGFGSLRNYHPPELSGPQKWRTEDKGGSLRSWSAPQSARGPQVEPIFPCAGSEVLHHSVHTSFGFGNFLDLGPRENVHRAVVIQLLVTREPEGDERFHSKVDQARGRTLMLELCEDLKLGTS